MTQSLSKAPLTLSSCRSTANSWALRPKSLMAQASQCDPAGRLPGWGWGCGAGRGSETLLTPPQVIPFKPRAALCRLAGQILLESTEVFRHRRRCTQGSRVDVREATLVFQPGDPAILLASWRADPGRAGSQLILRIPQMRPNICSPAEATGQGGRETFTTQGTRTHAPAMLVQGTRRQPGIFPLSDESAFQTIHPRVYFAPVWFV